MTEGIIARFMRRRPLVLLAFSHVLGAIFAYFSPLPALVWAALAFGFLALFCLSRRRVLLFPFVTALCAALMAFSLIVAEAPSQEDVLLTGRVSAPAKQYDQYTVFYLDDVQVNGEKLSFGAALYCYADMAEIPPYGARLSVRADVYPPAGRQNPNGFDYSQTLWREGIGLCATAWDEAPIIVAEPEWSLMGTALRTRAYLLDVLTKIYPSDCVELMAAFLLGERDRIPDELYTAFTLSGTVHLLALSGLHITCMAELLNWLLGCLFVNKRWSYVVTLTFLCFYALMVGFPASVLRAIVMFAMLRGAQLVGRPNDTLTSLSAALLLLTAFRPLELTDPGLILSFSSVAGMVLLHRTLPFPPNPDKARGPLQAFFWRTRSMLLNGLAVLLSSLPAAVAIFGSIPVWALLVNLLAIPLATMALPVGLISLGIGCIWTTAGSIVAFPASLCLRALMAAVQCAASLPFTTLLIPAWPVALTILYGVLLLAASAHITPSYQARLIFLALLPLTASASFLMPRITRTPSVNVTFLDVGQANAAMITHESGMCLIDVGKDDTVADALVASGQRPDVIFLTHAHTDHAGGLMSLTQLLPPTDLFVPYLWGSVEIEPEVAEAIARAQELGWKIHYLQKGDTLLLSPDVRLDVLQPGVIRDLTDENGTSLTLHLTWGKASALFTGDLPAKYEDLPAPDCDLLSVAHHGADASTSMLYLATATPSVAVISVGTPNSYGHPGDALLQRLNAIGASVYRTDRDGAVSVRMEKDGRLLVAPYS